MKTKFDIVITGGGTAGHIVPLLAVADTLKKQYRANVRYFGTFRGLENKLVRGGEIKFFWVPSGKIDRFFSIRIISSFLHILLGVSIAFWRLVIKRPDAIIAKGGYVSFPTVLTGWMLGIPIVNHESDAVLGLTNKITHRLARKSCFGFPLENYDNIISEKSVFTGTPVGPVFSKKHRKNYKIFGFDSQKPVILIIGGSQGAKSINKIFKKIIPNIVKKYQIIHMTGNNDIEEFVDLKYNLPLSAQNRYIVRSFLDEHILAHAFAIATIVVSRSGASSLADIAFFGKPSILIPLPWSAQNHQFINAKYFQDRNSAIVLKQNGLSSQKLLNEINSLGKDKLKMAKLANNIKKLAVANSAQKISDIVASEIKEKK